MSESCRMCGEILSNMTCPHCGSHIGICDGCDHTEPCRAVPAATWSQEPPTEAGDYWVWYVLDDPPQTLPFAVSFVHIRGKAVFVMPNGDMIAASEFPDDTWYMPATVPQPPGEVGP